MEILLFVILGLLSLNGIYWLVFWIRNFQFLFEFHAETHARKKLDKKDGR